MVNLQAFKSTASSDDEWIFSNRNDKDDDDDLNESADNLDTSINTLVPVNDYNLNSTDVVDAPLSYKTVCFSIEHIVTDKRMHNLLFLEYRREKRKYVLQKG